jgi:predicted phosphodiesterase
VKRAILSDIHGNLEALEAVLADIASQRVSEIICLGDIVGYGPNPLECIDLAMQFDACILGNHDQGALFDPEGFSSGAEQAIFWTRQQLEAVNANAEQQQERWQFLANLPRTLQKDDFLFVHGSPRNPLNEYIFPEDVYNQQKLQRIFSLVPQYCFQGHTHVPGVFTDSGQFHTPDELDMRYQLGEQKVMVNVGSVGQPRDLIPDACYLLADGGQLEYRRVAYPVEVTAEKIYAIETLDNFLGDRLQEGR